MLCTFPIITIKTTSTYVVKTKKNVALQVILFQSASIHVNNIVILNTMDMF